MLDAPLVALSLGVTFVAGFGHPVLADQEIAKGRVRAGLLPPAIQLVAPRLTESATPGASVVYSVTAYPNNGATVIVSAEVVSGENWKPYLDNAEVVGFSAYNTVQVSLAIPGSAKAGQTSTLRFTARSSSSPSVSASVDLTTTASALTPVPSRYVDASVGIDLGSCAATTSPCRTISYAMAQARAGDPGDVLNVAPGLYDRTLGEVFPIILKSGVALKALGSPADTIIDASGDPTGQSILVSSNNASGSTAVEGFTLRNGVFVSSPGAISTGGALRVLNAAARVSIRRNVFTGNEARGYNATTASGMAGGAALGGAVYIANSIVDITNNVFVNNVARGGSGYSHPSTPLIGAEAGGAATGGGLYVAGSGTVINNTFFGNQARGGRGGQGSDGFGIGGEARNGGLAAIENPSPTINNNVFAENEAASVTGGPASAAAVSSTGAPSITRNLYWRNTVNGAASTGDSLGTGAVTGDPLFVDAPANLRVVKQQLVVASSATMGAGTATGAATTDASGLPRPSPPSIGAYEPEFLPPVVGDVLLGDVSSTSAGVRVLVNPRGIGLTVSFEYGALIYDGSTWAGYNGASYSASLAGLTCGTSYRVRARAESAGGTTLGPGTTFTTLGCPTGESVLSIDDAMVDEGNAGSKVVTFTVTLSPPFAGTVTASYVTVDGTAVAGLDFDAASGILTFPPGETTRTIAVTVRGDTAPEPNEAFGVKLSGPAPSTLRRSIGEGLIRDDDAAEAGVRPQGMWQEFFAASSLETPYVGDFNGDSLADVITFTRQNPLAIGDVYVALSDGVRFGPSAKWHDFFAVTTDETVVIGDFDGDGKDDIATWLGRSTGQVYVARSTGSGMTESIPWLGWMGRSVTDVLAAGDVNGDGKDDLVRFARSEGVVYVAMSDGTRFLEPMIGHQYFAVSAYERPRVADVNGDGKADIITFGTDSPTAFGDVYVALSYGPAFQGAGGSRSADKWHDFFAIRPTEEVRTGDLNGDGRADFFTFLPAPFAQCYTVTSTGTGLGPSVEWPEKVAPLLGNGDEVQVGDVNGDRRMDIVIFAKKEGRVYVSLSRP